MKLPDPRLHLPIALLIASLLIGGSVFHFSLNARLAAGAQLIRENTKAQAAVHKVREVPAKILQDRADTRLYHSILDSGFIGPENRVGWVSALAQSRELLQLTSLSWHLSPQKTSQLGAHLKVSNLEFAASPLDPTSLSRLIEHLHVTAPGRFTVERCTLVLDVNASFGKANCHLNWWTLAQDAQ